MSVGALNETVSAARDYLNGVLAECETWEDLAAAYRSVRGLFPTDKDRYAQLRTTGVGADTLLKFLGSNWNAKDRKTAFLKRGPVHQNAEIREGPIDTTAEVSEAAKVSTDTVSKVRQILKHDPKAAVAAGAREKQREGGKNKVVQKSAQAKGKTRDALAKLAGCSHDRVTR